MAAPVPRADGTLKKKKVSDDRKFRYPRALHPTRVIAQGSNLHRTRDIGRCLQGQVRPCALYIYPFIPSHSTHRFDEFLKTSPSRTYHLSIYLRIRLSIRDLLLAQSLSSLPLPTPPNKQTNPPTNLTTNCKLHHLGPWFVFVDISSFGINIDVMDHSTKWRLALNPINQWIPPLSARCDRVTCPTTTWPIVDTSCTSLDHHQHSYQLPRASDQLRAPRPIPSSLSDKYVQEQYTVYPLVSFGSRITTVHLFPQQRV